MSTHLKLIVKVLMENRCIDVYRLFIEYRLTPIQIVDATSILEKFEIAKLDGDVITLLENGITNIYLHRFSLLINKEWKYISPYSQRKNTEHSEVYIPNYELIDRAALKKIAD